ncbi:MAG: TOBE domain-containing protein [Cyanobacteria bacterium Co-bin8]|nr:TOBE domain-containing protein [Cyanobacteria bacterium Co-bin8]
MPRKNQGWITFQASAEERQILESYCQRSQRTKTEILRELVRSLESAAVDPPLDDAKDLEEAEIADVPQAPDDSLDWAISARNLLRAEVKQVTLSGVSAEVTLTIGSTTELVSVITRASAERLHLSVGKEVYAVIKSNSVMIAAIAP